MCIRDSFRGEETKYNRAGNRNFCVVIPDANQAQQLGEDGWNVRILPPRNEDDEPLHYIQVAVRFDNIPPNVYMVTRRSKTKLDEESVDSLSLIHIQMCIRDRISLTYYADGVLADENDEVIEDVEDAVGIDSLNRFGEYEDDSVFVRNDARKCDYEILLDQRTYSEVVEDMPHQMEV